MKAEKYSDGYFIYLDGSKQYVHIVFDNMSHRELKNLFYSLSRRFKRFIDLSGKVVDGWEFFAMPYWDDRIFPDDPALVVEGRSQQGDKTVKVFMQKPMTAIKAVLRAINEAKEYRMQIAEIVGWKK